MADALIGTEVGSYRLTQSLGVGGMGAVYLGVHPLIGKRVAVKVLHAEFADKQDVVMRFFNEARAVSLLRHPNIVELIDFGKLTQPTGDPMHYCVMELLEGETLRDRLKRGPIHEPEAIYIAEQIADAVAAAHRQQIVHRDLKPENIFLIGPQKNVVKILDFGIAKLTNQGAASVQTQAGVLLGTPSYMSPEQCMGRPVDRRADIYALGIILFEMCTGRVPFIGEGYADLLIKQISADLPSPRSINPALSVGIEKVIGRALEKDPDHRFQSMEDVQQALAAPAQLGGPVQPMTKVAPGDATIVGQHISTTLSGAAAEMDNDVGQASFDAPQRPVTKKGSGGVLAVGVVAALLVAGSLVAFGLYKKGTFGGGATAGGDVPVAPAAGTTPGNPPATPSATGAPSGAEGQAPQVAVKKARLHISSDPAGAEVKRSDTGEVLGSTPLDAELPADGTLLTLSIHKDGFKDERRALMPSVEHGNTLGVRLQPEAHATAVEKSEPREAAAPAEKKPPKQRLPRPPKPAAHSTGDEILAPNLED